MQQRSGMLAHTIPSPHPAPLSLPGPAPRYKEKMNQKKKERDEKLTAQRKRAQEEKVRPTPPPLVFHSLHIWLACVATCTISSSTLPLPAETFRTKGT